MCPLLAFILRLLAISNARSSPSSYTCKVYQQSFYPFKLEYPRKNSPDRSPCISLKNSLKTLIKDQRTLCLAIIFFIHWTPRIRFTTNLLSAYRVQKKFKLQQIKGKDGKYGICPWIYKLCKLGCKCGIYQIFAFDLLLVCTFLRFIFICREQIHGYVNLIFRSVILMTFPVVCALILLVERWCWLILEFKEINADVTAQ